MAAKVTFIGGSISGNVVGFSVPKDSDTSFELSGVTADGNGTFFEERDHPNLLEQLGISAEQAPDFLKLLQSLAARADLSPELVKSELEQSSFMKWVLDSSTVAANLVTLGGSVGFPALVEIVKQLVQA